MESLHKIYSTAKKSEGEKRRDLEENLMNESRKEIRAVFGKYCMSKSILFLTLAIKCYGENIYAYCMNYWGDLVRVYVRYFPQHCRDLGF
jgi:hypothetical protein